ncbi:hypothetical protein SKAU_G00383140, partial [Synaphobranchus kaupii]
GDVLKSPARDFLSGVRKRTRIRSKNVFSKRASAHRVVRSAGDVSVSVEVRKYASENTIPRGTTRPQSRRFQPLSPGTTPRQDKSHLCRGCKPSKLKQGAGGMSRMTPRRSRPP